MTSTKHKPLVIQLLGQARSGKDFTAAQLKLYYESIGKSVEILSYAAPMKRIAASLFGISLDELDKYKNNPSYYSIWVCTPSNHTVLNHFNFRTFLQRLGNESMKSEFGNTVWAELMKTQISQTDVDVVIIPDCRFQVELSTCPGAITIRVINRDLPTPMNHASETELLDFVSDYELDNTAHALKYGNIEDFISTISPALYCFQPHSV